MVDKEGKVEWALKVVDVNNSESKGLTPLLLRTLLKRLKPSDNL